jgi:hypothetical protein
LNSNDSSNFINFSDNKFNPFFSQISEDDYKNGGSEPKGTKGKSQSLIGKQKKIYFIKNNSQDNDLDYFYYDRENHIENLNSFLKKKRKRTSTIDINTDEGGEAEVDSEADSDSEPKEKVKNLTDADSHAFEKETEADIPENTSVEVVEQNQKNENLNLNLQQNLNLYSYLNSNPNSNPNPNPNSDKNLTSKAYSNFYFYKNEIFNLSFQKEEAEKYLMDLISQICNFKKSKEKIFKVKIEKLTKKPKRKLSFNSYNENDITKDKEKEKEKDNNEDSESEVEYGIKNENENENSKLNFKKIQEKTKKKRLDYIDKEINKSLIRKPLELIINYILEIEIKTKEKLELRDFSYDVKIEALKNLHYKTIEEIFFLSFDINNNKEIGFINEINQNQNENFIKDFLNKNNFIQFKIG